MAGSHLQKKNKKIKKGKEKKRKKERGEIIILLINVLGDRYPKKRHLYYCPYLLPPVSFMNLTKLSIFLSLNFSPRNEDGFKTSISITSLRYLYYFFLF